jgi:peroxisomal membrane protein 4
MDRLDAVLMNPAFHDLLAILKGARNGFVCTSSLTIPCPYSSPADGVKVRAPHAFIMSILFGRGDWQTRAKFIYRATKQHALNLARFVTIYKTALLLQRRVINGGKQRTTDTFLAGLIGGWFVFRKRNAVNEQARRVAIALD